MYKSYEVIEKNKIREILYFQYGNSHRNSYELIKLKT